jgi:hypothetical protein
LETFTVYFSGSIAMTLNFESLISRFKSQRLQLSWPLGSQKPPRQNSQELGQEVDQAVDDMQAENRDTAFTATDSTEQDLSIRSTWLSRD